MSDNYITFASVYYEDTMQLAEQRLATLRRIDMKYPEIKAYIIPDGDKFRVLRRVKIPLTTDPQKK